MSSFDDKQARKREFFRMTKPRTSLGYNRGSVGGRGSVTGNRTSIGSRASFSKRPRFSTAATSHSGSPAAGRPTKRTSVFSFGGRQSRAGSTRSRHRASSVEKARSRRSSIRNPKNSLRRFSWFSVGSRRNSYMANAGDNQEEEPSAWEIRQTLNGEQYWWNEEEAEVSWTLPEDLMSDQQKLDLKKEWIWIPHPTLLWQPAWISGRSPDKQLAVKTLEGRTHRLPHIGRTKAKELTGGINQSFSKKPMNREVLDDIVDDLVDIKETSEGAILNNSRMRFENGQIYTWIGSTRKVLLAINPYEDLGLYTAEKMKHYEIAASSVTTPEPHIFGIAAACIEGIVKQSRVQSIIVGGESGSGKTQATKQCLDYITFVAGSMKPVEEPKAETKKGAGRRGGRNRNNRNRRNRRGGPAVTGAVKMVNAGSKNSIEEKILMCNPVLEAFGNAKTTRNNNSSRFGKWIEVYISKKKRVNSARIEQFLLETTRVIRQAENERNYHIFYQILQDSELQAQFNLESAETYNYTNQGGETVVEGMDDAEEFAGTKLAMEKLGFSDSEQEWLFRTCAALLHLGNVEFESVDLPESGQKGSRVVSEDAIRVASKLLEIDYEAMIQVLTTRNIRAGKSEVVNKARKLSQAQNARDSLAKAMYGKLFDWLVERINESFGKTSGKYIGILDIFGFESFDSNSYEQLCINFTNEKLQEVFNRTTFGEDQDLYQTEGIKFEPITFNDNHNVLDVLEGKPNGLFPLLDDECAVAGGTEDRYLQRIDGIHEKNFEAFSANRKARTFTIKHFAGSVEYSVSGFLAKNTDLLNQDLYEICAASSDSLTQLLFPKLQENQKVKIQSTGKKFREQLKQLVSKLNSTMTHYVRCIKPNDEQVPGTFNGRKINVQFEAMAMLDSISAGQKGFKHRLLHEEFVKVYKTVNGPQYIYSSHPKDYKKLCEEIIKGCFKEDNLPGIQVGNVRVLFRSDEYRFLELNRTIAFLDLLPKVQALVRGVLARSFQRRLKELISELDQAVANADIDAIEELERDIPNRLGKMGKLYGIVPKNLDRAKEVVRQQGKWIPIRDRISQYESILPEDSHEVSIGGQAVTEQEIEDVIADILATGEHISTPDDIEKSLVLLKELKKRIHKEELNKKFAAILDEPDIEPDNKLIANVDNVDDYVEKEKGEIEAWIERTAANALKLVDKELMREVSLKAVENDYSSALVDEVTALLHLSEIEFVQKEIDAAESANDEQRLIHRRIRKKELICANQFDQYKYFYMCPQLRNPPQEVDYILCCCIPAGIGIQEESKDGLSSPSPNHRMANRRRKFLSWTDDPFQVNSLVRLPEELVNEALNVYESIYGYMEEPHISADEDALKVVNRGIAAKEETAVLRDEIFTQIVKQLNGNPDPESIVRGVQLLGLCLATFAPSNDEFEYFLITWMRCHLPFSIYRHYMSALHETQYGTQMKVFRDVKTLEAKLDQTRGGSRWSTSRMAKDPWNLPTHHIKNILGGYDILDGFFEDFESEEELRRRKIAEAAMGMIRPARKLIGRQVKNLGMTLKRLGATNASKSELRVDVKGSTFVRDETEELPKLDF